MEDDLIKLYHNSAREKLNQKKYEEIKNKKDKLTKESELENFLIDSTTEKGKLYIEIY